MHDLLHFLLLFFFLLKWETERGRGREDRNEIILVSSASGSNNKNSNEGTSWRWGETKQCLRCLLKESIVGIAKGRPFYTVIIVVSCCCYYCCFEVTCKTGEPYCCGFPIRISRQSLVGCVSFY